MDRAGEYLGTPVTSVKDAVAIIHQQLLNSTNDTKCEIAAYQKLIKTQESGEDYIQGMIKKYQLNPGSDPVATLKTYRSICENNVAILNNKLANTRTSLHELETRCRNVTGQLEAIPVKTSFLNSISEKFGRSKTKRREALSSMLESCTKRIEAARIQENHIQKRLDKNSKQLSMLTEDISELRGPVRP